MNTTLIESFLDAASSNDVSTLERMLEQYPLLINAVSPSGWNALASAGGAGAVEFLLGHSAVSPSEALRQADPGFRRFMWVNNVPRAREYLEYYDVDLAQPEHHHQSSYTTLLHDARSPEMAAFLLDSGAAGAMEIQTGPGEEGRAAGRTPLQHHAIKGNREIVALLRARGAIYDALAAVALSDLDWLRNAQLDTELAYAYDNTLLHWAAALSNIETATYLLDLGYNVNAENAFGETPLIMAGLSPHLYHFVDKPERSQAISLLKDRGAGVDVFTLAALGDIETMSDLLDQDADAATARNRFNSTPLHFSTWAGHGAVSRLLIDKGADVNAMDLTGMPPLLYASYWGRHEETVEMLLERGADVYWKNIWGKGIAAYDCIFDGSHWLARKGGNDIHKAALAGDLDTLKSLLEADPGRAGEPSKARATPLHFAASGNQPEAIRLLLAHGANVEAKMQRGQRPIYCAARAGSPDAVRTLIDAGAEPMPMGEAWMSWTPLHGATRKRGDHLEVIEILLDAGHEVDADDIAGFRRTPLYEAVINNDIEKARVLIEHGASVNNLTDWSRKDGLLHACAHGQYDTQADVHMTELLIASGADANLRDDAGRTPLDVCEFPEIREVLVRPGAVNGEVADG